MIDAIERATGRPVSRETSEKLTRYCALLREGNRHQNLVSAATLGDLWGRHVLDSAQLVRLSPPGATSWVDIGSGAGLPGIVIACLVDDPVTLVEPRRLRADFLKATAAALGLNVRVEVTKAERITGKFDVITGRAVASLPQFLTMCRHLSTKNTVWILPRGRSAQSELADAQKTWQGVFHVEPSVTDDESMIVVATGVRAR